MLRRGGGLAKPGGMISPMTAQPAQGPLTPAGVNRYIMRQRMFALGQDFWINNAAGQPCFKIDGKVRVIKESLKFRDVQGHLLYKLDEKVLRIRESFDILNPDGSLAAKVHNAIIDPLRERFTIEVPGGENLLTKGKVIWAQYASNGDNDRNWYYNTGLKQDFNIYGKASYQLFKKLNLFADLQYRYVNYAMEGTLDNLRQLDQDHVFNFFNPKAGIFFEPNRHNNLYFSVGIANREPSRNNYKDADPGDEPTHETLCDYELGYKFTMPGLTIGANAYFMDYRNQLVLTGEINNVGEAVMVNVPHSYREGIEISAAMEFFRKKLAWNLNATFSSNKIKDFVQYTDLYDAGWNYIGQQQTSLGKTDLSFSPGITAGSVLSFKPIRDITLSLTSKYVGRQYIDNTSNEDRALKGYFINGFAATYTLRTRLFEEIGFNLAINNIFNQKYESNAWIYPYYLDGTYHEYNGYFPQALINFLAGITVKI